VYVLLSRKKRHIRVVTKMSEDTCHSTTERNPSIFCKRLLKRINVKIVFYENGKYINEESLKEKYDSHLTEKDQEKKKDKTTTSKSYDCRCVRSANNILCPRSVILPLYF